MSEEGLRQRNEVVVVANRLPVDRVTNPDGSMSWRRSPGGLVTALQPIMQRHAGAWIGWDGAPDGPDESFEQDGMSLVPVPLSVEEFEDFYEGFSNGTLWPLYHDVVAKPGFHREWWEAYVRVNRRFAEKAAATAAEGAMVWVQDYQLQLVPAMLRRHRPDLRIGFFLHIPFPPLELFQQLPWRREILEGLLGADVVGFQRPGGAQNFVRLVRQRVGHKTHKNLVYLPDGRMVSAEAFPISIDTAGFEKLARQDSTHRRAQEIREQLGNPRHLLLGVDRLDYTKGIYDRLRAYGELLEEGSLSVEDVVFVQVATPSRERVEEYRRLRDDIDRLVGRINGDFGRIGRPAVSYLHTSVPQDEMAALYRAADLMVVTPLRDGMNLVAKEYVACRFGNDGALVLSEFAGAADELRQAYLVNPYDVNGMKSAIIEALHASPRSLARRMKAMRRTVVEHDVNDWATRFLDTLSHVRSRREPHFPDADHLTSPAMPPTHAVPPPRTLDARPRELLAELGSRLPERDIALLAADLLAGADPASMPWLLPYLAGRPGAAYPSPGWHDSWVRVWAARALLYVWDDDAEPAVLAGLSHPAWRVAEMCAKVAAVRELPAAEQARPLLAHALPRVRLAALRMLGAAGDTEHVALVEGLLGDDDPVVRRTAARALERLRGRLDA